MYYSKNRLYFPLFCEMSPCSPVNESIAFIYICHYLPSIGGWSISKDDLLGMWCHVDGISFQDWDLFTATQIKVIKWVRIYNIVVLYLLPNFLSLIFDGTLKEFKLWPMIEKNSWEKVDCCIDFYSIK